jgi:hypothetical protein
MWKLGRFRRVDWTFFFLILELVIAILRIYGRLMENYALSLIWSFFPLIFSDGLCCFVYLDGVGNAIFLFVFRWFVCFDNGHFFRWISISLFPFEPIKFGGTVHSTTRARIP